MTSGNMKRVENEFFHPNGDTGYYEVSIYPVSEGILCIARDITDSKKAEQRLIVSEEKYRNIFEKSLHAIVLVDFTGKIVLKYKI